MLLGIFHGVPATKGSVFDVSTGPAHIVLYRKNIEAVGSNGVEVRHQIRQTLIHELVHYFGMTEPAKASKGKAFVAYLVSHKTQHKKSNDAHHYGCNVQPIETSSSKHNYPVGFAPQPSRGHIDLVLPEITEATEPKNSKEYSLLSFRMISDSLK